jgi:DNA polymerase-3 subunit delta
MTIVANSGADAFLKRLPRDMAFYLVHGSDEGLIRERVRAIVHSHLEGDADPLRLIRFDGARLAREPGALVDEADAVPMFGGRRMIWIELQARDIAPALEPLFKRPPRDCAIVVEAGSLTKGSALRSAFEKMGHGASIECYPDDRRSLTALIEAEAREANLRIPADVRDYLIGFLGSDRMTTRGEVAKLLLYMAGKGEITIADVEAVVSDAGPSALDDALDSAFLGDNAGIEETANRFFADGGDPQQLLTAIVRRALLLQRLRLEIDQGRSLESVLQTQHVRMSPLRRGALEKQVGRWSAQKLARLPGSLWSASSRVRRDARMAKFITMRALWALASSARSGLT